MGAQSSQEHRIYLFEVEWEVIATSEQEAVAKMGEVIARHDALDDSDVIACSVHRFKPVLRGSNLPGIDSVLDPSAARLRIACETMEELTPEEQFSDPKAKQPSPAGER
jgi:hypothetical protein